MGQSVAVNPAPRSVLRDLTWVTAFVIIVVWWLVIGGRHILATTPKPAVDYLGFSCGYGKLHDNQFLYYPLKPTEHSLAKGLAALELDKPVCVLKCPTTADAGNGFTMDDISPGLSGVYGDDAGKSKAYPAEQFSNFLCLPQDRSVGTYLTHALKLSNSKLRAWMFASSISSGGAYWLLVAIACLSLVAGAGVNYWYLKNPSILHLAAFGIIPSLTVALILCSHNIFHDYSRVIMTGGVASLIMSMFIICLTGLVAIMLVTYRARTSIGQNVSKVYISAAKSIPGLWVMPSCCALLMILVLLISLRISCSVLLTTPGIGLIPFKRHLLDDAITAPLPLPGFMDPHPYESVPIRQLAGDAGSGDVATQLGKEIGKVIRDKDIQKPVTLPFRFTPSPDLFVHGPDGGIIYPQNKLPPNHPGYRHPGYHGDSRPGDGQMASDLHVVHGGMDKSHGGVDHAQAKKDGQVDSERQSGMTYGGVVIKTSWINVINLFAYLFWCVLILEAIISVSNTFVAAWTTVWYYSPPDIGGERGVEMSAMRYASLTTLSSHLSNVIAISAVNALLRPLTTAITLAMFIPAVHRWWVNTGRQENRIISPLYNLASCATTLTTAHSLIHGHHLFTSTKTLVNDDLMNQCTRAILRFVALAHHVLAPLTVATASAILALVTCTITPSFIKPSDHFYVEAPMLTAFVAFVISYYITLVFSSAIMQSVDCLICCYQFERDNSSATAYTPDEFSMIHSDVRAAALDLATKIGQADSFDLETPEFMRNSPAPQIGYETDILSESSILYKGNPAEALKSDNDAVSTYLRNDGGMTFA